ncbi:MAG: AAA family ATPase [Promethearchaeota archaeon]
MVIAKEQEPWTLKYAPHSRQDIVGNEEIIKEIIRFINLGYAEEEDKRRKQRIKKRALLLVGPPGIGKTSSVLALTNSMNRDLVIVNASDKRNKAGLKPIAIAATYHTLTDDNTDEGTGGQVILVDEVDGSAGHADRGGIQEINKIIDNTRVPIIITCNDDTQSRLSSLKKRCKILRFKSPTISNIVDILERIAVQEQIKVTKKVLEEIARRSQADIRASINNFQSVATGKDEVTLEDLEILSYRDIETDIYHLISSIFVPTIAHQRKIENEELARGKIALELTNTLTKDFRSSYNTILYWIYANAYQYALTPEELVEMYDFLTKADIVLNSRIIRRQDWKQLKYFFQFLTLGLAASKKTIPTNKRLKGPWELGLYIPKGISDKIAAKIAPICKLSQKKSKEFYLPMLKVIFTYDPKKAADLAFKLKLFDLETKTTKKGTKIKIEWTGEIKYLAGENLNLTKQIKALVKQKVEKVYKTPPPVKTTQKKPIKTKPEKEKIEKSALKQDQKPEKDEDDEKTSKKKKTLLDFM